MLRLSPRGEIAIPIAFSFKESANSVKLARLPRPRTGVSLPRELGLCVRENTGGFMAWGRLVLLAMAIVGTVVACSQSPRVVQSTAQIKRAFWGLPQAAPGADVTSMVTCPGGYPCDVFANGPAYNDSRFDIAKRLTVIWTCQPQNFVLSEIATPSFKVRMACVGGAPAAGPDWAMRSRCWARTRRHMPSPIWSGRCRSARSFLRCGWCRWRCYGFCADPTTSSRRSRFSSARWPW